MLATSENVLFPGSNHRVLITLHSNCHSCWRSGDNQSGSSTRVISRWLGPGNRTFLEVASMVVTWWIVAFLCSVFSNGCVDEEVLLANNKIEPPETVPAVKMSGL